MSEVRAEQELEWDVPVHCLRNRGYAKGPVPLG